MTAHTPGPWHVGGIYEADREDHTAITADDGTKYHRRLTVARAVQITNLGPDHPVHAANASLLASAPDLFVLAQQVRARFEIEKEGFLTPREAELLAMARAAIAKATGGK